MVKVFGSRLPMCSTDAFAKKAQEHLPETLRAALGPVVEIISALTVQIKGLERKIEALAREVYPETALLAQVSGVGTLTSLAFVLTVEDPRRFPKCRSVGSYLGLRPRQADSGALKPQLRITKAGDEMLRGLLVECAHHILGRLGPDTDLKRWGLKLAERGGKAAKKRAVFDPEAASLFFSLVSSRYEQSSLIVSSNKTFSAWAEIFGDPVAVAALVDRLVHHADVIVMRGESYRLKGKGRELMQADQGD